MERAQSGGLIHRLGILAGKINNSGIVVPIRGSQTGSVTPTTDTKTFAVQGASSDTLNLTQKLSPTQARTVAENIYKHILATGGKSYGNSEIYDSPGEIVEIKGVADGGEKKKEVFRQISNNITTRGNVFSVYGVGQSLKQLPSGRLNILAEQRVQTMVERFSENGQIRFSPLFFRILTP